jgi:serine O-acetyltransferase
VFFKNLREDIKAAKTNDPAARNWLEVLLTYSGVHALSWHRVARFFYKIKLKLLARMISQTARFLTGIEIHPAAKIEGGVFIDHGSGVVIGETAEVRKGTVIYQGVTLGGTGKERGKRHPTIMENVTISAGAKVLGGFTVGKGAKIGAGAVVLKEVPPYATVVGIPGKIVCMYGEKVRGGEDDVDLRHDQLPDPEGQMLFCMQHHLQLLQEKITKLEKELKK